MGIKSGVLLVCVAAALAAARATGTEVRTIHLRQDDAQVRFASKVYELEHISAEELLPFVNSAVLRYDHNSTVRRVTSENSGRGAMLVSTGRDFLPLVDAIVAALDRPGKLEDGDASPILGTGMARVAYTPQYRAALEFSRLIDDGIGSSSGAS